MNLPHKDYEFDFKYNEFKSRDNDFVSQEF